MSCDLKKLLCEDFSGNAPASAKILAALERSMRKPLPSDFREFLLVTNGGEGPIGDSYFMLWSAEEIEEYNRSYQVDEYAPGLLLFGSDGGGEAYAFDTRKTPFGVVTVPFVGMSLRHASPVAPDFAAFLAKLGG